MSAPKAASRGAPVNRSLNVRSEASPSVRPEKEADSYPNRYYYEQLISKIDSLRSSIYSLRGTAHYHLFSALPTNKADTHGLCHDSPPPEVASDCPPMLKYSIALLDASMDDIRDLTRFIENLEIPTTDEVVFNATSPG